MATQIVKPEDKFAVTLASLQAQSASIAVKTPEDCLTAKTMQRDVRNYMKDVHLKLDPFVESAKRNLAEAKDELNKWLNPAEAVDDVLAQKVKDFERLERERTQREQDEYNRQKREREAREADERRRETEKQA